VALCDPNQENCQALGTLFRDAAKFSNFGKEQISALSLDLVILASPVRYHRDQAVQALQASIAVLCEKPIPCSANECNDMINSAQESGSLLACGLIRRFFPAPQLIHHIVSTEVLGKVISFRCADGGHFAWQAKSAAHFERNESGGGVLIDLGFHAL